MGWMGRESRMVACTSASDPRFGPSVASAPATPSCWAGTARSSWSPAAQGATPCQRWTAGSRAPPPDDRGQLGSHRDPTRAAPYDRVADLAAVSRAINGGRGATWGSPGPPL